MDLTIDNVVAGGDQDRIVQLGDLLLDEAAADVVVNASQDHNSVLAPRFVVAVEVARKNVGRDCLDVQAAAGNSVYTDLREQLSFVHADVIFAVRSGEVLVLDLIFVDDRRRALPRFAESHEPATTGATKDAVPPAPTITMLE